MSRRKGSGHPEWIPWGGCPLVNPLCPDDLCQLEAGHDGTEQHKHHLGTMVELEKVSEIMYLGPKNASKARLIEMGSERAQEMGCA